MEFPLIPPGGRLHVVPLGAKLPTRLVDAEEQLNALLCNGLRVDCGTLFALTDMLLLVKTGKTHEAEAFAFHHSARLISD